MAYADSTYYTETYGGTTITDPAELSTQLSRASDDIDSLTFNRILDFDDLTAFQQAKVQKAVCLQADYRYQYGDYFDLPVDSYSLGDISMTLKKVNGINNTSNHVLQCLKSTGLTSRIL
jgi:hypothetical protein